MTNIRFSHFSNILIGDYQIGNEIPFKVHTTEITETWKTAYPTRSIMDDLENKRLIVFFGDSFTYGHGICDDKTFASVIHEKLPEDDYAIINFGQPGMSNDGIMLQISQWFNTPLSSQTYTIVVGWSFVARRQFWFQANKNQTDFCIPHDPVTTNCIHNYNFSPGWPPSIIANNKKYTSILADAHNKMFPTLVTPILNLINFEKNLAMLKLIYKLYNINVLWWCLETDSASKHDIKYLIDNMTADNTNGKNCSYIDISGGHKHIDVDEVTFSFKNRHWNNYGNKLVGDYIYKLHPTMFGTI